MVLAGVLAVAGLFASPQKADAQVYLSLGYSNPYYSYGYSPGAYYSSLYTPYTYGYASPYWGMNPYWGGYGMPTYSYRNYVYSSPFYGSGYYGYRSVSPSIYGPGGYHYRYWQWR
jgi:hypothetical protein